MRALRLALVALFFATAAHAQVNMAPLGPLAGSSGGGGGVTPSGTFTAGDLIVGAGTTSIQDAANQAAPVNSPTAILRQAITGSAPASICAGTSLAVAFSCPLAGMGNGVATQINGVATLTQPTTTYQFTPNLASYYTYFENNSGWNQNTGSSLGRTGAVANYTKVNQFGQGDAIAYFAVGFATGQKAGATLFLANSAVAGFGSQLTGGAAGVYLQPNGEFDCADGSFDVACIGTVINLTRTATPGGSVGPSFPTGALGATWIGQLMKCGGSVACDAAYSAAGTQAWNVGLDLADGSYGTNQAAIVTQAAQRWYLSATTGTNNFPQNLNLGTDFITAPAAGKLQINLGGSTRLDYNVAVGSVWSVTGTMLIAGNVDITGGNILGLRGGATALSSPANNVLQIGTIDQAAPSAQTMQAQNVVAGTSNTNGQNWTIAGSRSTGTGVSGDIIFQTGGTGAGASVQNSLVNALVIKGATQSLQLPAAVTGTPTASLCLDASNNIIKKTTTGSCV